MRDFLGYDAVKDVRYSRLCVRRNSRVAAFNCGLGSMANLYQIPSGLVRVSATSSP